MYEIEIKEDNIEEVLEFFTENIETCIEGFKEEEGGLGLNNSGAIELLVNQKLNILQNRIDLSSEPFQFDFYFIFKYKTIYDYVTEIKNKYISYIHVEKFLLLSCVLIHRSIEEEIYSIENIIHEEEDECRIYLALTNYSEKELPKLEKKARFESALAGGNSHSLNLFYVQKYILSLLINSFAEKLALSK